MTISMKKKSFLEEYYMATKSEISAMHRICKFNYILSDFLSTNYITLTNNKIMMINKIGSKDSFFVKYWR